MAELEDVQAPLRASAAGKCSRRSTRFRRGCKCRGRRVRGALGRLKRRVLLAKALAGRPTCCSSTSPRTTRLVPFAWIEGFLLSYGGTLLFVTTTGRCSRSLATRIVDLDRGRLTSWAGKLPRPISSSSRRRWTRGNGEREIRQEARGRGGLDPPGGQGAQDPEQSRVRALKELRRIRASGARDRRRNIPGAGGRADRQARGRGAGP